MIPCYGPLSWHGVGRPGAGAAKIVVATLRTVASRFRRRRFATGGPVSSGQVVIIGERGPEETS